MQEDLTDLDLPVIASPNIGMGVLSQPNTFSEVKTEFTKQQRILKKSHPWEVTLGADVASIAPGAIGWIEPTMSEGFDPRPGPPYVHHYKKYRPDPTIEDPIEYSGAGYFVAVASMTSTDRGKFEHVEEPLLELEAYGKITSNVSILFTSDPDSVEYDIVLTVAEVDSEGNLTPILTHNPIIEISNIINPS